MLSLRRLFILARIHHHHQLYKKRSETMSSSMWPGGQQESDTSSSKNDTPECEVSVTTKHKGHDLKTKHQIVSKADGPNVNDAKSSMISTLISCIEETDRNMSKNKAKLQEAKNKIVLQCDKIKTKADTLAELYTKQCEQCETESTNSLQKYRENLHDLLEKYLSGKDDNSSGKTASDTDIPDQISGDKTKESTCKSHVPAPPQTHFLDFKPGTVSMEQFQKYFGDLLYCYNEADNGLCERQSLANSSNDLAKVTQLTEEQISSPVLNTTPDRCREDKALEEELPTTVISPHSNKMSDSWATMDQENELKTSISMVTSGEKETSKPPSEQNQTTETHGQPMHFFPETMPAQKTTIKSEEPNISEESQTNDLKFSTVSSNTVPGSKLEYEEPVSQAQLIPQSLANDIPVAGEGNTIYETSTSPPRHMQHIFPKTIIKDMSQTPKDIFKNSKVTTNKGEQQILTTTDAGYMKLSHEGKLILPHHTQKDDPRGPLIPPHPTPESSQQKQYLETNLDEKYNATSKIKNRSLTLLKEYVFKKDLETLIKSVMPFSDHIYLWFLRKLRFNIIDKSTGKIHLKDIDSPSNVIDVYQSPVDNTIWFCCWDGSVWQITRSGNKRRMIADQSIRALCVTHEGNVVVSMDVKIILYNTKGQELNVRRRRDLQLEEKTWKIADCGHSKRLAVSDRQNIVVMDYMLNFLFKIRRGHTVVNVSGASSETGYMPHKSFEACGLCFSLDGNLLVCDTKNKMLLKFNQKGQYMETVRNVNMFPQCINRFNNQLYVAYTETLPMQVESQMTRENRRMMINTELLPDVAWHVQILQE